MSERGKTKFGWQELLAALFILIAVIGGSDLFFGGGGLAGRAVVESDGQVRLAFTAPSMVGESELDQALAAAIDGAQTSVDVAAYDFDLAPVAEALVRAHQDGLRVRLVTDSDYADEYGPVLLQENGIPVVFDERGEFMHNKFVVVDGTMVWTGSWNLTENGTYRNDNNVVLLNSSALAENYTVEFEEMFVERQFGPTSPADTPNTMVKIGDVLIENYFSSEEDVQRQILAVLEDAQSSIYLMAFVLTDNEIAQALARAHQDGLDVQGVVEARNFETTGSDVEALRDAGVEIREDGNAYSMHHKVFIVDEEIVITGSYNFSRSAAEFHDENLLILHGRELAAQYLQEFDRVYREAK
jgi:phosphatidylserine/phosphatidylglycerophosphate/cardiolipin synthase-like enzyme